MKRKKMYINVIWVERCMTEQFPFKVKPGHEGGKWLTYKSIE